jgi:hypothetical protein
MRKSRLSLLVVATVIATILVAGCTSSNQSSPQIASTNTSSTTASATTTSAVKTASVTPSPSASASPTPTGTPTASPTATPQPSGKIATTINGNSFFSLGTGPGTTIVQGTPTQGWGFEVAASNHILSVPVTVTINGKPMGTVTQVYGGTESDGYVLSAAETASLSVGTHPIVVTFAGNSQYAPATPLSTTITVVAPTA